MIVVDSSVWIDYFNGETNSKTDYLHMAIGAEVIIIGDIILTEVLQGFQSERHFRIAKKLLLEFPIMEMLGQEVAIETAVNYRKMRQRGITVRKTIDVMIATFCIHNGFSLLHNDRDFDVMEKHLNLKVVKV